MNKRLTEIVNLLEESRSALLGSVESLSQQQFDNKTDAESWSVGEILNHLHVTDTGVTRILNKQIQRAQNKGIGPDTNEESIAHSLDQYDLTTVKKKIKAPKGFVPEHGNPKEEVLNLLKTSRSSLMETIGKSSDFDLTQLEFPHPMIGKMNMYQWILFVDQHERRHTNQLKDVLTA